MTNPERISILNALVAMMFNPLGRDAVVSTFSQGDYLSSLLRYYHDPPTDPHQSDPDVPDVDPVIAGYSGYLMAVIVECSDDIDLLERFAPQLMTIAKKSRTFLFLKTFQIFYVPKTS